METKFPRRSQAHPLVRQPAGAGHGEKKIDVRQSSVFSRRSSVVSNTRVGTAAPGCPAQRSSQPRLMTTHIWWLTTEDRRLTTDMRIFIALDIDDAIRERLRLFVDGVRGFAPDARWVRPESMHVTSEIHRGEISRGRGGDQASLWARSGPGAFEISFRGYGFFPTSKAPRVFWIGIEAGPQLAALAKAVDEATAVLLASRKKNMLSVRISLWRAEEVRARHAGAKGMLPTNRFSACRRNWPRCQLPSLVR